LSDNLNLLSLSGETLECLTSIINEHRQEWEAWIESAEDYASLKSALMRRGFKNAPISSKCMHNTQCSITKDNLKKLPNQKTMLRRSR